MNNRNVFSNLLWRLAERTGAQGVSFIVSLVLARLLMPKVYGTVALVTVITAILQVFVDSGLGSALIQKKNADELDFSTVFFFNITVCIVLYILVFFTAPSIAFFYKNESLAPIIRVLSLKIVISGLKNVQQAYVSRNLMFKRFFFSTLGGTIGAAIVGIVLACNGFGVWALVIQQVFNATVDTLILWFTVKWHPRLIFSFKRLKDLFSYGWKLLVSAIIDTVYKNIRQLIIGRMYSPSDLAFYNQGELFPKVLVSNINTSIDSVLLPVMSKEQDDKNAVKNMTKRAIKTSVYIMAPLMMGLSFTAPVVVELVLTKKWLPCVPFLRIFCITYMFYPIHTANLNAIKAMGRSDLFLKLEIIKKIIGVILLLSTMWFGVMAMAYSLLVSSVLSQIINSWPNRKLLYYSYQEQIKDILPSIGLALFMGVCVLFIPMLKLPLLLTIIIQIVVGGVVYVAGSSVFKIDSFVYLKELIYVKLKSNNKKNDN